jgi:excisionase family DNA binding protein
MLTVKQAANMLTVSPALVYALCACGQLAHERYGLGRGTIRIRESALAEYQARASAAPRRLAPARGGVFRHLDPERLERAWRERGVS